MRRETFAQAAAGVGASALNRVFERYPIPITFSSEQLHLHMIYNDVDAGASPLWYDDDGNVLAAALLAIRAKRGWIGGFGVAPEYRHHGYAAELSNTLKDTARARGLASIQLEVLSDNIPAVNAYRSAGFEIARTLLSFECLVQDGSKPSGFVTSTPDDFIDLPDARTPCWQRERRTLRNGAVSTAVSDGGQTYALFRFNRQVGQVLKLGAPSAEAVDDLAAAIAAGREFQSILLLNEPEDSPIAAYVKAAGWTATFTQYEMLLHI
ncbi:MAG TPA: GNAT family N-acetyltransferase [Candidatus Baltobacteraceae bacterium]|nr:GNAT family N-acetyltransferase [Candidatus Baltobacteraceae bacterium]